jgi:hypothetical protein
MCQSGEKRDKNMAKSDLIQSNSCAPTHNIKILDEHMDRRNVKLIKNFVKQRKRQQAYELRVRASLDEQRKSRYIDKATYDRLQELAVGSNGVKRIGMLDSLILHLKSKHN